MSISREIAVRVISKQNKFSDLFIDFVTNFWVKNNEVNFCSLGPDDVNEYNFTDFQNFDQLKPILDQREARGLANYVNFLVAELDESISISCVKDINFYNNNLTEFQLKFTPGIAKRLERANRYTDYGFYLNQIIPKLREIGCEICEIKCHDFDF
jgi:hypothetical protein